jgi:hypothetical protein
MKRFVLFLIGLLLLTALGWFGHNLWQTTRYFADNGREATLVVGERYNTSYWATPPLKKIHTFTALLSPRHEVLIETDRELSPGESVPILFLPRDLAANLRAYSLRPLVNSLRLRTERDGAPVRIEDTDPFDRLVDRAMGPPAPGTWVRERPVAEAAPDRGKPTVPFILGTPGDAPWTLLRRDLRVGEWLALGFFVLAIQWFFASAWENQRAASRPDADRRDFIHPSLRRVDAAGFEPSQAKLTYVPKPDAEIVLPEAEMKRLAAERAAAASRPPALAGPPSAAPSSPAAPDPALTPLAFRRGASREQPNQPAPDGLATAPLTPNPEALPPLTRNETAPPLPPAEENIALKLPRKRD